MHTTAAQKHWRTTKAVRTGETKFQERWEMH